MTPDKMRHVQRVVENALATLRDSDVAQQLWDLHEELAQDGDHSVTMLIRELRDISVSLTRDERDLTAMELRIRRSIDQAARRDDGAPTDGRPVRPAAAMRMMGRNPSRPPGW
jgi:hypothetical protein